MASTDILMPSTVFVSSGLLAVSDSGAMLTRYSIRVALAWYFAALLLMLSDRSRGHLARWCWTLGLVSFVVHVGLAFHHYDRWSHAAAFERTRQESGVGEGLYVSYLFTLVWIGDVVWRWCWPVQFQLRSIWFDRCLHTFMLFIVFNSTVVFETGLVRWLALAMFGVLIVIWLTK